jgi:FMN reductase
MSILLVSGSPSELSRSAALLDAAHGHLEARGARVERLRIRDLSPQALLLADWNNVSIARAAAQVQSASAVVVATPVYKAAYSGALKVFLDLLPQSALKGKVVLPMATGGSPHHMLALDYALRPVLQSLGARHILPGIYATEAQVVLLPEGGHHLAEDIAARVADGVTGLLNELPQHVTRGAAFEPVPFERIRCSV